MSASIGMIMTAYERFGMVARCGKVDARMGAGWACYCHSLVKRSLEGAKDIEKCPATEAGLKFAPETGYYSKVIISAL